MALSKRTKPRDKYHHGDLKRALVDAAIEIVAESSAESFTFREAARRAGVNHRAAYRHFADKTSLLAAVAEEGFHALIAAVLGNVATIPRDDVTARIHAIARTYLTFAVDHAPQFQVMFGPWFSDEKKFARYHELLAQASFLLEREIAHGVERKIFRPGLGASAPLAIWSTAHGLACLVLMRKVHVDRARLPRLTDRVVGATLRGIQ